MEGQDVRIKPGQLKAEVCKNCGQTAHFQVPDFEVVNQKTYSSYHFSHENAQSCEHCGQKHLFILGPMSKQGPTFAFIPIEVKGESGILLAPDGSVPNIRGGGRA